MKVINKVNNASCIQWIEPFVQKIIQESKIFCKELIIEGYEYNKRICLSVDSEEYVIKIWNFYPLKKHDKPSTHADAVICTLLKMVKDDTGGHGEEIYNGLLIIEWKN